MRVVAGKLVIKMFKFLSANVSTLCMMRHFRTLQCYNSALYFDQRYTSLWRETFAGSKQRSRVSWRIDCQFYAKQVPRVDIAVQADDIWTELCRASQLPPTNAEDCKEIIKLLLSFHYHRNHILRALSQNTVLLQFPVSRWKETASDLQSFGFQEPQILPLLSGCHMLLHGTVWNNLHEMLIFLQGLQIPYPKRLQVIVRNPALLLSADTRPALKNYGNLLKVFTKNEAQTLVVKNPSLLTDLVDDTNKKINYVYHKMGIRSQEIVNSQVFMHSFAHIVTRHQFAERAGVYKMPDKHEISAKANSLQSIVATANPSLSDLVDTSNATFVDSFCSMTVAEYKAFEAMKLEELDKEMDDDEDSDLSDSDYDSE